jgi:hypothetical protein
MCLAAVLQAPAAPAALTEQQRERLKQLTMQQPVMLFMKVSRSSTSLAPWHLLLPSGCALAWLGNTRAAEAACWARAGRVVSMACMTQQHLLRSVAVALTAVVQ